MQACHCCIKNLDEILILCPGCRFEDISISEEVCETCKIKRKRFSNNLRKFHQPIGTKKTRIDKNPTKTPVLQPLRTDPELQTTSVGPVTQQLEPRHDNRFPQCKIINVNNTAGLSYVCRNTLCPFADLKPHSTTPTQLTYNFPS